MLRIPGATYRIQLNGSFRFQDVLPLVPYLRDLGITDLYCSPILKARSGSLHGYDVTDPTRLNPELGSEGDFQALCRALSDRGMGLLLDIVPNHMAACPENAWFRDVLARGRASARAAIFDIDWDEREQIVLPILGQPLREAIGGGAVGLGRTADGEAVVRCGAMELPLRAGSLGDEAPEAANSDPAKVEAILSTQHYRLAFWREGRRQINYRRFFDVSDLIGIRVEDPEVFRATHALILEMVARGQVTGLRIDHIDGLRDPLGYLERLGCAAGSAGRPSVYLVVEKILLGPEELRAEWPVFGTTGYDFMNRASDVFVDRDGYDALLRSYSRWTGEDADFADVVQREKQRALEELFPAETERLVEALTQLAHRSGRRTPRDSYRRALTAVAACFPVYRTYVRGEGVDARDRAWIDAACDAARAALDPADLPAFDLLRQVLMLEFPPGLTETERGLWLRFVLDWQQFTGPLMAKGLEDTALYVFNVLVALNKVGSSVAPVRAESFHRFAELRAERWPHTMNTASTHDTKRSADVRARIDVLAELSTEWEAAFDRWTRWNGGRRRTVSGRRAPDANEEVFLYQTLLGSWPLRDEELPEFRDRLHGYFVKALREAKRNTSWLDVDAEYEEAVLAFADALLDTPSEDPFRRDFLGFLGRVAPLGALVSLGQTLLAIAAPGVPDFYQGAELWDFSLADPDNRRPVDFAIRRAMLAELDRREAQDRASLLRELRLEWADGRVKLYLISRALRFRADRQELFSEGAYIPLCVEGEDERHVLAFARHHGAHWAAAAVPRRLGLRRGTAAPLEVPALDGVLRLPEQAPRRWENLLTGERLEIAREARATLSLGRLLAEFPVALLRGEEL
jgi:(1->4)-alpha-D-glucan 1-alpha-D-glucosylmutase